MVISEHEISCTIKYVLHSYLHNYIIILFDAENVENKLYGS